MNKIKFLITAVILAFSISSCELDSKELIDLRNEVRYLETEIASIRSAPGFILGEAFEYIDAEDYNEAVTRFEQLQKEFPEWNSEVVKGFLSEYSKHVTAEVETDRE